MMKMSQLSKNALSVDINDIVKIQNHYRRKICIYHSMNCMNDFERHCL